MRLKELQTWTKNAWKKSDKKVTEKDELLFLFEEIGEVAEAIRIENGFKKNKTKPDLEDEFGNVLLSLITLANRYNVDLEKGMKKTIKRIEERYIKGQRRTKWKKNSK